MRTARLIILLLMIFSHQAWSQETNEQQWINISPIQEFRQPVYTIDDVDVIPDVQNKCIHIKTKVVYHTGYCKFRMLYSVRTPDGKLLRSRRQKFVQQDNTTIMEYTYPMGRKITASDENDPALFTLTVLLMEGPHSYIDMKEVSFRYK